MDKEEFDTFCARSLERLKEHLDKKYKKSNDDYMIESAVASNNYESVKKCLSQSNIIYCTNTQLYVLEYIIKNNYTNLFLLLIDRIDHVILNKITYLCIGYNKPDLLTLIFDGMKVDPIMHPHFFIIGASIIFKCAMKSFVKQEGDEVTHKIKGYVREVIENNLIDIFDMLLGRLTVEYMSDYNVVCDILFFKRKEMLLKLLPHLCSYHNSTISFSHRDV